MRFSALDASRWTGAQSIRTDIEEKLSPHNPGVASKLVEFVNDVYFAARASKQLGRLGCAASHLAIMLLLAEEPQGEYLVLEDDVKFSADGFQYITRFFARESESRALPLDWTVLYLRVFSILARDENFTLEHLWHGERLNGFVGRLTPPPPGIKRNLGAHGFIYSGGPLLGNLAERLMAVLRRRVRDNQINLNIDGAMIVASRTFDMYLLLPRISSTSIDDGSVSVTWPIGSRLTELGHSVCGGVGRSDDPRCMVEKNEEMSNASKDEMRDLLHSVFSIDTEDIAMDSIAIGQPFQLCWHAHRCKETTCGVRRRHCIRAHTCDAGRRTKVADLPLCVASNAGAGRNADTTRQSVESPFVVAQSTTVLTTSCRRSSPNTDVVQAQFRSLKMFAPELTARAVIAFDGSRVEHDGIRGALSPKCLDECDAASYEAFKHEVRLLAMATFDEVEFVEMESRSCLVSSLRAAMSHVRTHFVYYSQMDLALKRRFNITSLLGIMSKNENDVGFVRLSYGTNAYHEQFASAHCEPHYSRSESSIRDDLQIDGVMLSPCRMYSDRTQVATIGFYEKIWPLVDHRGFMEKSLMCAPAAGILNASKMWYADEDIVVHLDGRHYGAGGLG